jgi:hypothetical protein
MSDPPLKLDFFEQDFSFFGSSNCEVPDQMDSVFTTTVLPLFSLSARSLGAVVSASNPAWRGHSLD